MSCIKVSQQQNLAVNCSGYAVYPGDIRVGFIAVLALALFATASVNSACDVHRTGGQSEARLKLSPPPVHACTRPEEDRTQKHFSDKDNDRVCTIPLARRRRVARWHLSNYVRQQRWSGRASGRRPPSVRTHRPGMAIGRGEEQPQQQHVHGTCLVW